MKRKEELLKLAEEALTSYIPLNKTKMPENGIEQWDYVVEAGRPGGAQSCSLYFCLLAAQLENP